MRHQITFTEYLYFQRNRNDRVGDLAQDWLSNYGTNKPRRFRTARTILKYLESVASHAAMEAARQAVDEWQSNNAFAAPPDCHAPKRKHKRFEHNEAIS